MDASLFIPSHFTPPLQQWNVFHSPTFGLIYKKFLGTIVLSCSPPMNIASFSMNGNAGSGTRKLSVLDVGYPAQCSPLRLGSSFLELLGGVIAEGSWLNPSPGIAPFVAAPHKVHSLPWVSLWPMAGG